MSRLRPPRRTSLRHYTGRTAAWLLFGAAIFALAELGAGIFLARFFDWGRAEALLFLAFRPWLLLIAALRMAEAGWRSRYALYALALLVAGTSEALLLIRMGASNPWPEMLRAIAAGALLSALFDAVVQAGCRVARRAGKLAATAALVLILLIPGALRPYEMIVIGRDDPVPAAEKPPLIVMTSLPIIWGEGGPFDAASRPSAAWRALQDEFATRPIDYLDASNLASDRLMLLAQPRRLAPEELVALDEWVRGGGRILIFADPALIWPTSLPPGDVRRPPLTNMLTPLLTHWGVEVEAPDPGRGGSYRVDTGGRTRLLRLAGHGRLRASGEACRNETEFIVSCRIGEGRAIVVADSDLLHDFTSIPPGVESARRHDRLSDNLPAVADWLDRLAGIERPRAARPVQWADPDAGRRDALLHALLPILAALLLALIAFRFRLRRNSPTYPQG